MTDTRPVPAFTDVRKILRRFCFILFGLEEQEGLKPFIWFYFSHCFFLPYFIVYRSFMVLNVLLLFTFVWLHFISTLFWNLTPNVQTAKVLNGKTLLIISYVDEKLAKYILRVIHSIHSTKFNEIISISLTLWEIFFSKKDNKTKIKKNTRFWPPENHFTLSGLKCWNMTMEKNSTFHQD